MADRWVSRGRGRALGLFCALIIAAAGAWLGWRWRPHHAGYKVLPKTADATFPLAICNGVASQAEAVITGELRLHQALLAGGVLSTEALHAAVVLQLRYAFASAQNTTPGPTLLIPDGPPRSIEILTQKSIPYGNDLELDWPADPQLQPESDYVQQALLRRNLSAADAAIRVTYRARVGLAVCEKIADPRRDRRQQTDFQFPVPHDPYLLYWHIGKEHRIEQVYGKKRAHTFPCADPEIADYAHPEYLWYFWQPQHPRCAELLPTPRVLGSASLHIVQHQPPSGDFMRVKQSFALAPANNLSPPALRVVLVFGYLDHQVARPDLVQLQQCLTTAVPDPTQPVGSECAYGEWGAAQYGHFLQTTSTVLADEHRVLRVRKEGLEAQIQGRLRRSGRPVTMTAYLTETDFLAPAQYVPRHVPLLMEALREAEVVIYVGHSGLGINFAITQLQKVTARAVVDETLRRSPVRLLGFVGCYTYSYFGRDFGQLAGGLGGRGSDALFVYTGNAVEQTAASALHILATLDCILQSPDGSLQTSSCDLSRVGSADRPDFLIYEFAR